MTTLTRYKDLSEGVEGWFTELAATTADAILRHQALHDIRGDMLEIGVHHGRSAILWLLHAAPGETVHLVEFSPHVRSRMEEAIARVPDATASTHYADSYNFPNAAFLASHRRSLRLIHIDGGHGKAHITNDLNVCADLLHLKGVIVVDDFLAPPFPQVSEAVFAFLRDRREEFALFACGGNKAFICTARQFAAWSAFAEKDLSELLARDMPGVKVWRGESEGRLCLGLR